MKCKNLIGGRGLTAESHGTYMEAVWTAAMTKHVQKISLAQKRSAVYTVMQNKFSGMLAMAAVIYLLVTLNNAHQQLWKIRFVSSLCRQKMCHVVP
jgi:hypothetical protein